MYENELKSVDSMPGSINELISTNKRLRRPPSLSESFALSPENIARANLIPLISSSDYLEVVHEDINSFDEIQIKPRIVHWKYEKQIVEIFIKLLLHITLISIFETLFYFLYVSSLEDNGIIETLNTFINGAVMQCENLSPIQIDIVDDILGQYINATTIIQQGNIEESNRFVYNERISLRAWIYVGVLMGLFVTTTVYIKVRRIEIKWRPVILENVAMVLLLALYELMFFNTIIYPYHPISADEIGRNAIETLQSSCGILEEG